MTTQLPLKTDYQAVRAQLEGAISQQLAMVEEQALAQLPNKELADEMRGGYVRDVVGLVSLFTPDYYAECVESFDGDPASHDFLDFCVQELNENLAHLALVAWPNAIGREHAWSALSFPLEQRWADKVSIIDEDQPMTDNEPQADLIMLDANFTDREVFEEYSQHILADDATEVDGELNIKFFVLETSYAYFRAQLEAREGITDVCALGEVVGTPSGEITQEMRDKMRSLFSAGKGGTQAGDEVAF